jgi:hypothetical protein
MKFFGFGGKPEWRHADAARRAAAVAASSESELLDALPAIARADTESRVRIAAIRRLEDPGLLRPLATSERDAAVIEVIAERLLHFACTAGVPPDESARAWIASLPLAPRTRIARDANHAGWRRAALAGIDRPALLVERCLADPDPALRLELLAQIDDLESLERIAQKARRDDKRLARLASERGQSLRLAAGDPAALRAVALAVGERLAALRREPSATLSAGLAQLESEWQPLAAQVDAATAAIVGGHFAQARAALARASGEAPTPPSTPAQQADDATRPAPATPTSAAADLAAATPEDSVGLDNLRRMVDACTSRAAELDAETLDGLLAGFDAAWQELPQRGPSAALVRARFDALVAAARDRFTAARAQAETERRARVDAFQTALVALAAAIGEANVAAARGAAERLDAAITALGEVPRDARRDEASARQGLAKLIAHQRWSLNRQRADLGDAAEALLGQGLHPDAVAARVRELREAWEHLDAIARAAGDEPDSESGLARRFRGLTGKVLAPTRRYFSERQKVRAARAGEFEALAEPLDSGAIDDRTLALRRRAVASALRQLDDVDPARRGELGRKLRAALARLDASRSERAESAELARRRLLSNLGRRLARAELSTALAAARDAEAEWLKLPRVRADLERTLRAELDALVRPWYEREQAGRSEAEAARETTVREAESIAAELDALARVADASPSEIEHRIAGLRRRWQTLEDAQRPAAPVHERRDQQRPLRPERRPERPSILPTRRFEGALKAAEAAHAASLVRAEADARVRRAAPLMALRALEAEATRVARGEQAIAPRPAAELAPPLSDDSMLPTVSRARRDAAVAVIEGRGDLVDWIDRVEAAGTQALELAVCAECIAGIDSPADDAATRRRIQVGRLESRMRGGAALDPQAELLAIEDTFNALGPIDAAVVDAAGSRIASAAAALRSAQR